ncbi:MAG: tRNA lysidine(34) synthetase TilS [Leptolyngbyaceae cyanobacterium SL_5_9]|nr:tRNA lysidine(34) synthetase TilS [Leptolyngbyaceae cyanobacterium SL_5_9]NJO76549.1 tRNA lysidine(34) synthetase TilS [Leptolyngbyaceae cyanobacterium RM1_406_9]
MPWTPIHASVHRTIRARNLLQKSQRLLVAVSGGQDSLCLVRLLLDLQPKWNWTLAIAHCNHRWRVDSSANADYVEQLAQGWEVPYFGVAAVNSPTSEAAAREWRYGALAEVAQKQGYAAVVTGHTASDRAETLLYNLIRGSGADGLQALTWQRELNPNLHLVRPLLEITRAETAQFCQTAQLRVWQDSTNQDLHYARNRIRQELLPYLKTHFNPQVEQALSQTAELLRGDIDYLETAATALRQQATTAKLSASAQTSAQTSLQQGAEHRLNRLVLKSAHSALQRRVMRQWLQQALPEAPNFDQIEKLTALISAPNRTQTDPFPGGAIATVQGDWICLKTHDAVCNFTDNAS